MKKFSRSNSSISTNSSDDPSWFADFVSNLEKNAVRSKEEDNSLFNQINSILGNKSKYSSVEEAVIDMQKRTGLYDVLNGKSASAGLINEIPAMKTFIDNYVEDRPGTSVEAVVHDLVKLPEIKGRLPENNDVPDDVKRYISNKILEVNINNIGNRGNDLQLGRADLNTDDNNARDNNPFAGCEPNVKGK